MSFSDDYVPNAEGNISIMSDAERSEGHSDIDIDEINDVLLKNLESDVFSMQNEVKQKDSEMRKLLEELQEKFYAEKDMQFSKAVEDYEDRIRALQDKVDELEASSKYDKEQIEKYFSVVETLENENEKLRDENRKQQTEIALLSDKIQKMGQANNNRSTANSSGLYNAPASPINQPIQQRNVQGDRRNFVLEMGEDYSTTSDFEVTGFLKNDNLYNQAMNEGMTEKLDLLKEKLANEQNRSKELEFMVVTQKNIIENTNESMSKLKQENKELEAKIEKLRSNADKASQNRIVEKTKIDSVVTFCELMDNCVFPKSELVEKLSELPIMLSSYLKGETETIAFNKHKNTNSKLVAAARKIKAILDKLDEENEKGDKNYGGGRVASELDDIKHGISNLTQFLSKAIPPNNQNHEPTQERENAQRMQDFKYNNFNEQDYREQMNMRNNNFKSSMFIARAMQNTNPLLWNFNNKAKPGARTSSEGRL